MVPPTCTEPLETVGACPGVARAITSPSSTQAGLRPCWRHWPVRNGMLSALGSASALAYLLLFSSTSVGGEVQRADFVLVDKSERRLYLYRKNRAFAAFPVAFGAAPTGHKQQEGDERTPEGRYTLDYKKADSGYYRAIHISYPNRRDVATARRRGVQPGGFVMIHGQKNGYGWASFLTQQFNWTNGCVALSDDHMETVWQAVAAGTPIEIRP